MSSIEKIKENRDFTSMSNTDFEVLFDALDRTDEVQFRTLFTPLAQTNMVSLIRSQTGYGDDFVFVKANRMNFVATDHSQGRDIVIPSGCCGVIDVVYVFADIISLQISLSAAALIITAISYMVQ